MKRLLCIVSSMDAGGAETFLMKVYRTLDKKKYQMDFCVSKKENNFYEEEIKNLGGNLFYVPPKTKHPIKNFFAIIKLVRQQKYKYVLRTNQQSLSVIDLIAAKLGGAKKLIFRSSNAGLTGGFFGKFINKLFSFLPRTIPNVKIAPSSEAAIYVFGKKQFNEGKVIILNNAIDFEKFEFNEEKRKEKRKELKVDDKFVVGHIGRFNEQKNHTFLIDIFEKIYQKNKNAILLLVGKGELEQQIKNQVKEKKLDKNVIFLGIRKDIPELLMSMDIFLFPSFFEGMPNTIIEAQATGLKCILSDTITKEANITGLLEYISLSENADYWSSKIENVKTLNRNNVNKEFSKKGYTIDKVSEKFIKIVFG